jgi:2-polyprenyl-3-methyl-5-hydroxy-6-metoxy-1,4-benzoquinol methylase
MFNNVHFSYMKCANCSSVFVDPVPDDQTFARMYAKAAYHDCHYEGLEDGAYAESAELLKRYVPAGASVLDYGCGLGAFLKALRVAGFDPYGVEFDGEAAGRASERSSCVAISVQDFEAQSVKPKFDVIHFGDVLEHLADPGRTLAELLCNLKPEGLLFVEGPLEINPSPVYWSARLFGAIKRLIRPKFLAGNAPTHLFRTGEKQQMNFFSAC